MSEKKKITGADIIVAGLKKQGYDGMQHNDSNCFCTIAEIESNKLWCESFDVTCIPGYAIYESQIVGITTKKPKK